ncbi:MAG: PEGA domain-containing protein, partial [bacterium]
DNFQRIQHTRDNYKNVNELVAGINEEIRRNSINTLLRETKEAVEKANWQTATEKYQAILSLEPNHAHARTGLTLARQEQDLAELYAQGQEHYQAENWQQAIACFRQIQSSRPRYKDVDILLATAERRKLAAEKVETPVTTPYIRPQAPLRKRRIFIASAAAFVVLLVSLFLLVTKFFKLSTVSTEKPPSSSAADSGKVIVPPQPTTAKVSIQVSPAEAAVILDGARIESSQLDSIALSIGRHAIAIVHPGFDTLKSRFSVTRDTTLTFSLQVKKTAPAKPEPVTAVASTKVGGVHITSEPSGAEIFIKDQSMGATPRTIPDLTMGDYGIVLKKTGYEDHSVNVIVESGKTKEINAKLDPLKGKLKILVKPSGLIYIDGALLKTNVTDWYETDLAVGPHRVKMESPRLGFLEKTISIETDKPRELSIDFNKMVTLTVTAFDESGNPLRGSLIYVDNEYLTGRDTPKSFRLHDGHHLITVRREGYTLVGKARAIDLEEDLAAPLKFILRKEL